MSRLVRSRGGGVSRLCLVDTGLFGADKIAPTVPGNFAVDSRTATTLVLVWDASEDNVGVVAYEVEYRVTGVGSYAWWATTVSETTTITGLTEATGYDLRVRAVDAAGNVSAWSTLVNELTADETAPTVPGNLAASAITATTLTLAWDPSSDNVAVTEYEVQQRLASGVNGDYVTIATVTAQPPEVFVLNYQLAVTGLTLYTEYRFRVRARDAAGNVSAWGPNDTGLLVDMFTFNPPSFDGHVHTAIPDGLGGMYVGGEFLNITDANGTHSRMRLAHIDYAGNVTSWDPGSDQSVRSIAIIDADYVAVAKTYNATLANNTLGGYDCLGFGVVHRGTGVALSWNPSVAASVTFLTVDGGRIFRTAFSTSSTVSVRSHTVSTQTLDSWNPSLNAASYHVAIDQTDVVISFTGTSNIYLQSRAKFGKALKAITGGAVAGFDAQIVSTSFQGNSVTVLGDLLLLTGSSIQSAGAQAVAGAALVDRATGAPQAWSLARASTTITRHCAAFDRIVAHSAGDSLRIYDLADGSELVAITVTGQISYPTGFGSQYWMPRADRCVVYGDLLTLSSNVVSGTSRMFVIDVP